MKKILLLCSMIVYSVVELRAQTVYFSQDFNSSPDKPSYIGVGQNQFTAMDAVGTATVNIVNNKLQIVKTAGTGINRASATKSSANAFGPAKFLKYSVELTLSNNNSVVDNAFQFTVGAINNTAPANPGNGQIHSIMLVEPTTEAGKFTFQSGLGDTAPVSQPFSGTVTVVWYVNNSGKPVGYTAPDGTIHSLPNDANSIWVVQGNSAVLAIDRAATAVSPAVAINSFKISNNPNFDAILDIDNIVLSEEPVVVIPEIVSVAAITGVEVPMRTSLTFAMPTQVEVTYDTGKKGIAGLTWAEGATRYNGYRAGDYPVIGTLIPAQGTINPKGFKVESIVTVRPDMTVVNAFTPNGDGRNDTWIVPDLKYYPEVDIQVFDQNGVRLFHTTNPEEGWDGKNHQGKVVSGNYLYIINNITNSLIYKGVLTVIKD